MKGHVQNIKQFFLAHERHITTGAFLLGFVVDTLTLKRIDLLYENLVLFGYLFVAALSILFVGATYRGYFAGSLFAQARRGVPIIMQFAFGGLFSAFFIFYTKSATFAANWPFLLVLLALLIGNEFFRKRYERIVFQVSVFFFALFSFAVFYVPIVVGSIGVGEFLLSGLVSLGVIALFIFALELSGGNVVKKSKQAIYASVLTIFAGVNILFFTGVLPPIPLSLKEAGVYHSAVRVGGEYVLEGEEKPWYAFLRTRDTIHKGPGEPVYVFSSVFAPTDLEATIVHEWQHFNLKEDEWRTRDRFTFAILGGRDGGYRGYTQKRAVAEGLWRVNIETARGQLIGREVFEVVEAGKAPVPETITR